MGDPTRSSSRSAGQWIIAVCFGLLAAGFFLRFLRFGYKWVRHVAVGDANFKVLTVWALVYAVVCGVIAAVAFVLPRDDGDARTQNGERGT
jgi:hypothetical protein